MATDGEGPKPPPKNSMSVTRLGPLPSSHVVPTVQSIINDTYSLIKSEVDAIRRRSLLKPANGQPTGLSAEDSVRLKRLLESLKLASDLDTTLQDMIHEALAGHDEGTLAELAGERAGEPDDVD